MKQLLLSISCSAICLTLHAQECKGFYYLSNHAEVKMTVYDRKGEVSGVQTWTVSDVNKNSSGYTSTITSVFTDDKGKETAKGTGQYKCENGILKADMKMSVPQQQMETYNNMDVQADVMYIEYPSTMREGQALPDADFKMDAYNKNTITSTITFKETNRKVEGKEKVTSPAGSWDAYKITYDGQFKATMAGIGIPMNFKGVEWFVPGLGIVKTETLNKNGKLMGSTLVTSLKQ